MESEKELLAMAQSGDKGALNSLLSLYWQPIYRLIIYKVGNADDSQELTQETFLRGFRTMDKFQAREATFKTYLGRIALNLVTDYWRKKGRSPQVVDLAEYQEPLVDHEPQPEQQALAGEQQEQMACLIKRLPDEQRQAVELRIIAGLSVREAAEIMGKSEPALKMLQQRALKNLRKLCEEQGITG